MRKSKIVESEDNLYTPCGVYQKEVSHLQFPLSIFVPPTISDQYPPSFLPHFLTYFVSHIMPLSFSQELQRNQCIDFNDKMKFIVYSNKVHEL